MSLVLLAVSAALAAVGVLTLVEDRTDLGLFGRASGAPARQAGWLLVASLPLSGVGWLVAWGLRSMKVRTPPDVLTALAGLGLFAAAAGLVLLWRARGTAAHAREPTPRPDDDDRSPFAAAATMAVDFWFAAVAPERLRLFQRLFTLTFFIYLLGWTSAATEWLTVKGFHLSAEATSAAYPSPAPALPVAWLGPFLVLLFGVTILGILDVGGRATRIALCALAWYVQMVDQPASFTLNKIYVVFFFVLAVASAPAEASPSTTPAADAPAPRRWQSAWPIRCIQATLLIQYCTAGICKAAWGDWLFRTDVLFTHTVGIYRNELAAWVVHHMPGPFWVVFAWGALLFELFAPVLFMVKRLRVVGMLWGIGFHAGVALLMHDLIFFSEQMICIYILFVSEERVVQVERALTAVPRALRARLIGAAARGT